MTHDQDVLREIDKQRASRGFYGVSELLELAAQSGNTMLDPFSTLISRGVVLGTGNLLYPNVILSMSNGGQLSVGNSNAFYPNTLLIAEQGTISIADRNQFGDGGCSLRANTPDAVITVGNNGRYMNGAQVMGRTILGSGSQVLGPITVQNCALQEGGDYRSADPDGRAGLLKGSGLARGISVPAGKVLNGLGMFRQEQIEDQSKYHPKK
jgi:hypothetical protein